MARGEQGDARRGSGRRHGAGGHRLPRPPLDVSGAAACDGNGGKGGYSFEGGSAGQDLFEAR